MCLECKSWNKHTSNNKNPDEIQIINLLQPLNAEFAGQSSSLKLRKSRAFSQDMGYKYWSPVAAHKGKTQSPYKEVRKIQVKF